MDVALFLKKNIMIYMCDREYIVYVLFFMVVVPDPFRRIVFKYFVVVT